MADPIFANTELDYRSIRDWFASEDHNTFQKLSVSPEHTAAIIDSLGLPLRRCYLTDDRLTERIAAGEADAEEIVAAVLPDAGSTMAGDFGEVLSYVFHLGDRHDDNLCGPKKWRLKEDRTKPSPKSDVVHFHLPDWPDPGPNDEVLCSEVKVKSTNGASKPITSALEDSKKDRASRLATTLVWLKERTILGHDTDVDVEQLARFIDAIEHPAYKRSFFAIAVICASFADAEITEVPDVADEHHKLLVIVIPELREVYTATFAAAKLALLPDEDVA